MTDQHLPPLARELRDLIGEEAMHAICAQFGGLRLQVPMRITPDSALPLLIGKAAAARLVATYGGDVIEPPKLTALHQARRAAVIRAEAAAGATGAELATRHNITMRHVRRILAAGATAAG